MQPTWTHPLAFIAKFFHQRSSHEQLVGHQFCLPLRLTFSSFSSCAGWCELEKATFLRRSSASSSSVLNTINKLTISVRYFFKKLLTSLLVAYITYSESLETAIFPLSKPELHVLVLLKFWSLASKLWKLPPLFWFPKFPSWTPHMHRNIPEIMRLSKICFSRSWLCTVVCYCCKYTYIFKIIFILSEYLCTVVFLPAALQGCHLKRTLECHEIISHLPR